MCVSVQSKLSVESLLKQERLSRSDAETENLLLHKNVKKLEADLQASSILFHDLFLLALPYVVRHLVLDQETNRYNRISYAVWV